MLLLCGKLKNLGVLKVLTCQSYQSLFQPVQCLDDWINISVLTRLNHCHSSCSHSIVLLMNNAGCHPYDLNEKYSGIRIVFLPPNMISRIQPLDLGIIQNFIIHYQNFSCDLFFQRNDSALQIVKSVLMAIRWVAEAWDLVK